MNSRLFLYGLLFISLGVVVIGFSDWQARYNYDPHHWGLMLSNAKDLIIGRTPYKEIFIQYGFLTAFIQSAAYLLNNNLTSIIIITSLFYLIGLFSIFLLARAALNSFRAALLVLVLAFSHHPIVIYPWSNYILFPFFIIGVFYLINMSLRNQFFAGILLGCAVLCREGSFLSILALILFSLFIRYRREKLNSKSFNFNFYIPSLLGFVFPLAIFFIYLYFSGLYQYWHITSVDLPRIYLNYFPHIKGIGAVSPLINTIVQGCLSLNPYWILYALIILACTIYLLRGFFDQKNTLDSLMIISFSSLIMLTSSLHIPEIFRLASGTILGLIVLVNFVCKIKGAYYFFWLFAFYLFFSSLHLNSGNMFFPSDDTQKEAEYIRYPAVLSGFKWPKGVGEYYNSVEDSLLKIGAVKCGITYHYNSTKDSLLQVISPFKQYQLAPFGMWEVENSLRPDLNFREKIHFAKDIVVIDSFPSINKDSSPLPPNYFSYLEISVPSAVFMPEGYILRISVPNTCKSKLGK